MKRAMFGGVFVFATLFATAQVTQINNNKSLEALSPLDNVKTLFASGGDNSLWVSEGTLETTLQISNTIFYQGDGMMLGNRYVFSGSTASTGTELCVTDGTPGGTQLVEDINTGSSGSEPAEFALLNGYLYFTAATDALGRELWRTDGTSAGTTLVKDINPGIAGSNAKGNYTLFSNSSYLLFAAQGTVDGTELWKSDGTAGGTLLVKDIAPASENSNPENFFSLDGTVTVFTATNLADGAEFYRTDGTQDGTFMLKDINPGAGGSTQFEFYPGFGYPVFLGFYAFSNKLFFAATNGLNAAVLYSTDGSTVNTTAIKVLISDPDPFLWPLVLLPDAVRVNNKFYFPLTDGESSGDIWETNGTSSGTVIFKSYPYSFSGDMPFLFVNYEAGGMEPNSSLFQGNKFFFSASTDAAGNELYLSDGTDLGTSMVKDINTGSANGIETTSYLFTSGPMFFAANNGVVGNELWKTDGTGAGTVLVKDINNAGNSDPYMLLINNNKIFFSANDGDNPTQTDLYVVDGTFTPLPLSMGAISVAWNKQDAVLNWQTLQEENSSYFIVQRSIDAIHFADLATVRAAGRSVGKVNYTYADKNVAALNQTVYYRVVCTNTDGSRAYSRIVNLTTTKGKWQVSIAGNQPGGNKQLQVQNANSDILVQLFDINGKQLWQTKQAAAANAIIQLPNLNAGSYYLVVSMGNDKQQIKLIQ